MRWPKGASAGVRYWSSAAEPAPPAVSGLPRGLFRYAVAPIAAGVALGFAWLWLRGSEPSASGANPANVGYAEAVSRAAPAVVNILALRPRTPLCNLPRFRAWCEQDQRLASALGSGVMVREDGYILTNHHVIAAGDDILVGFNDGSQAPAAVVGTDPVTDLAVLKVDGGGYRTIAATSSDNARVGDVVLAIGNPFGIGQAVSQGIVSAKGRYGLSRTPYDDWIQTDAAVNPGNSGGALVDSAGRLLGINTLIYSQGGGSDGIGLAIPVDRALRILDEIVEHGQALHGRLGVGLASAPPAGASAGLAVLHVFRGTPAAAAGLRPGDVLLSVNGEPATDARAVMRQVLNTAPGQRLSMRVLRNGAVRVVEARSGLLGAAK